MLWRPSVCEIVQFAPQLKRISLGGGTTVSLFAMTTRRRITQELVRRLALAMPEACESSHFARPDFRVHNKIFATLPPDGQTVVLRLSPANVDALVSADGATFWDEWRGRWLGIRLDRVALSILRDLVADAWRTVAPKRLAGATKASGTRARRLTSA